MRRKSFSTFMKHYFDNVEALEKTETWVLLSKAPKEKGKNQIVYKKAVQWYDLQFDSYLVLNRPIGFFYPNT